MSVKKKYREHGIAKKLLIRALDHVRELKSDSNQIPEVVLLTSEIQKAAMRFYSKHGFLLMEKGSYKFCRGLTEVTINKFTYKL